MRIKISTKILEKRIPHKRNYTHEVYAMILKNLPSDTAEYLHAKVKRFKMLTFTNVYMKYDNAHFYVAGKDEIITEFIKYISFNQMIRIGDMVLMIEGIEELPKLEEKSEYHFKSSVIVNMMVDGKTRLMEDMGIMKYRLIKIAKDKAAELGIPDGNIDISIINPEKVYTKYSDKQHINSWKCILKMKGDYEVINTLYNIGAGENTASGHGFLWEV